MWIYIVRCDDLFSLDVQDDDSIDMIINRINEMNTGISENDGFGKRSFIKLVYHGNILNNTYSLKNYDIRENSTLHILSLISDP